jgi:GTP-binding protein EngB required for normal cell division
MASVSADELRRRADALADAIRAGGNELDPTSADLAQAIVEKVERRTRMVGGHTVVALAGATGSGKSSLFNAIVGSAVAKIGARRPTTSTPTAAVWGKEPAGELLDWLEVGVRHHVPPVEGSGVELGTLDGLVLLDLPDFDSRETRNREEAERILHLVDVFVWVTDPQKYADARLHDDYVAALHHYDAVTMVVLNQADRLAPDELSACSGDLERLLERDGLGHTRVLATSATTGHGVDELRQRLANAVAGSNAARDRLAADVRTQAERLREGVGSEEAMIDSFSNDDLVDALSRSAGIPTVVAAVERDYRLEAWSRTGWPFTRWLRALRPSPLRRLRLGDGEAGTVVSDADVRRVLGRSSLPPPTPAARSDVALTTRRLGERAAAGLPPRWGDAVRDAATPAGDDLADELDQAVMNTSLRARSPGWWSVFGWLQLLWALSFVVGFLWLAAAGVIGWLQLPDLPNVTVGELPVPFLLFGGGLVLGLLFALLARWLARIGARRRAALIRRRLRTAVQEAADKAVVAPVAAVLNRHAAARTYLDSALG